jgi:hypothetical protein
MITLLWIAEFAALCQHARWLDLRQDYDVLKVIVVFNLPMFG